MIVNSLQELKDYLRGVIESIGTKGICQICNTKGRDVALNDPRLVSESCCARINCDWFKSKTDCGENIPLKCMLFYCPILMFRYPKLVNYLNRIYESISYPYELKYPLEIEEFKDTDNEKV